ncbi:hypothetical protein LSM04_007398 [Trypanosoma melophagium]|uniref:uncharacterized protein n=1 Tax=Trypanosoma melophagium TaxID=715481 RepID=UPI00351A9F22|nr:hypothetical protein LSM04_007398 [Trypanosoma melophagium]
MPNSIVNSNNDGGDIIKEEIAQLRALLDEGGLHSGVLEGKYLNQVKRARQLGVQLESEKTYSQKLERQLASLEAELQRVNSNKGGLGISPTKGAGGGRGSKQTENSLEGEENSGEQQNVITSLKERLERAYVQLNESKLQLEEQKKETQRLRKVLLQEVGGTPQELDTLLKNASEGVGWRGRAQQIVVLKGKVKELERQLVTAEQNALNNMNNDDPNSAQGQRVGGAISTSSDVMSTAAGRTTTTSIHTTNSTNARKPLLSGGRGRDLDDVARDRVVEVQNRRLLLQRELQEVLERRTAELEEQRRRVEAAQARYVNLETDNRTLRDYLHTVLEKTENDNALIDAYREEIEELRQALRAARVKLQEWELWESKATPGGGDQQRQRQQQANKRNNNNNNNSDNDVLDTNTAVALAGADAAIELNRLKMENMELRNKLAFWEASSGNNNNNNNNNNTTGVQNPSTVVNDDTALVLHWLRSVAPSAEGDETTTNNTTTKTKTTTAISSTGSTSVEYSAEWQRRVADVLRRAHAAVRFLEQQREEEGNRLSKCYATIQRLQEEKKRCGGKVVKAKKGKVETHPSSNDGNHMDVVVNNNNNNDMNSDDDDAAKLTSVVLQENHALKQRLKMMQELMEKERLAYESLRAASDVSIIPNRTTATTTAIATEGENGSVSAAVYQQLRRQYEELRLAFNTLQKENLKRGAN